MAWTATGSIRGPAGPKGDTGAQGPQGEPGTDATVAHPILVLAAGDPVPPDTPAGTVILRQ